MDIHLRVGGKYLTRSGATVKVVKQLSNPEYPFLTDSGLTFSPNGRYSHHMETAYDLVREIPPVNIQIHLGGKYRTGAGDTVQIIRLDTRAAPWPFGADNGRTYAEDGRTNLKDHIHDIIEELPVNDPHAHIARLEAELAALKESLKPKPEPAALPGFARDPESIQIRGLSDQDALKFCRAIDVLVELRRQPGVVPASGNRNQWRLTENGEACYGMLRNKVTLSPCYESEEAAKAARAAVGEEWVKAAFNYFMGITA